MQYLKRILDGFLFGIGFCIAVAVVVVGAFLAGVSTLMQEKSDEFVAAYSGGSDMVQSDAFIVVASNLSSHGGACFVTATISNATAETFSEVAVIANVNHADGEFADFRVHETDAFPGYAQTNILIEFEPGTTATLIDSPTFDLEIMTASSASRAAKPMDSIGNEGFPIPPPPPPLPPDPSPGGAL